ncbi:MAG: hypothetical protein ACOYN0_03620 [Phycisphaerales bacterium]
MSRTASNPDRWSRILRSCALGAACFVACAGGLAPAAFGQTKSNEIKRSESGSDQDVLVLRDGKVLTGTILSEDKTKVRFKRVIAGIPLEEDIELKRIAEIKKASKKPSTDPAKPEAGSDAAKDSTKSDSGKSDAAKKPEGVIGNGDGNAYYWIKLDGVLGREISQTPVREALLDAQECKADVVIVEVNSKWTGRFDPEFAMYFEPGRGVDGVFRVEPISTIFTSEITEKWKPAPRIVMWVKEARGGIAPLPFAAKEIYFHSTGHIGGLGGLESIFEGVGDEVVREKQRSLRLGHLIGICEAGGHNPLLMRAMTRRECVLTLATDADGKPLLVERLPEDTSEELLTDSGEDVYQDNAIQVGSGDGNDWLDLPARRASLIGLSKGTVDTPDELLLALGLDRAGRKIEGQSTKIMKKWRSSIDAAERSLRKAREELADVRVEPPAGYNERKQARTRQKKLLQEMKRTQETWGEGLLAEFLQRERIPPIPNIEDAINDIEAQQKLDKKE